MPFAFAKAPMRAKLWTPAMERGRQLQCWLDADDTRTVERYHNTTWGERHIQAWYDKANSNLYRVSATGPDRRPRWHTVQQANQRHMVHMWQSDYIYLNPDGDGAMVDNPFNIGARGTLVICVGMVGYWIGGQLNDGAGTYLIDRAGNLGNPLMSIKCLAAGYWGIQMRSDSGNGIENSPITTRAVVSDRVELFSIAHTSNVTTPVTHRVWAAGESVYAANPANLGTVTLQYPRIGYDSALGAASDARVGEYLVFNDGEDNRLRQRAEGYLAHKWGVPLAKGHPYATVPPSVIAR